MHIHLLGRIYSVKESLSLLGNVLLTLVAQDKESLSNTSIIISFCKHCGEDYAGLVPYSVQTLAEKHKYTLPRGSLLPPEKQKPLKNILKEFMFKIIFLKNDKMILESKYGYIIFV